MIYFLNNLFVRILLWGFLANWARDAKSQPIVESHNVEITYNKTSSLIFPAIIKSVDRGSRDVIAQKAKGVGNVLQLKAGRENIPETNLTVITSDGTLHQFTVNYSVEPASLTMNFNNSQSPATLVFETELTETEMENCASGIIQGKRTIRNSRESKHKINFALLGIYIKDDMMFYRFRITNESNINYDIDFLKFYIRDKAQIKRTASQEIEVKPIYVYGNDKSVKGGTSTDLVYALTKLTIPESKHFDIEMFEQNGGRHFELEIKNKTIVKARLLE
jgi:conjugative transposon TraN protein